ncbi:hypothetical protein ACFYV7_06900 [Nocardia suismassiliense]|uniref:Secreted protein n=1 Tax=Nocardia suismassiliense TaxID=2077092 RepID=A0ABW6QMR6_9NOCA
MAQRVFPVQSINIRRSSTALLAIAAIAGGLAFGAGTAAADAQTTAVGAGRQCLWAGAPHPQGTTVAAGGQNFRCGTDRGAPVWSNVPAASRPSTVPNPGAYANPAGLFSAGARQPGTEYTDYCVGGQLIEGNEDIYQVVADRSGKLYWKAAGPISQWVFDPDAPRHGPSWRSASLCSDGNLT